jgi:hypothetical protein
VPVALPERATIEAARASAPRAHSTSYEPAELLTVIFAIVEKKM